MFRMSSSRETVPRVDSGEVVKQGYLKKLKTMRKKYFVLRGDSVDASARLEYYESEKKWKTSTCNPKRSITLKSCFNINKRNDTRHKWVIALYTRNDKFCIVFDNEEEMEEWLQALLELQHGAVEEGGQVRPNFEHVWEVLVHPKELGSKTNMTGLCRFCLTDQSVTLVKPEKDESLPEASIIYSLKNIRLCGHLDTFFYMEVGQWTTTGAGNLWFQAEDPNIAQNIHTTIMKYLEACGQNPSTKEIQPKSRERVGSFNETARPTGMSRWPTHSATSGGGGGGSHQRTYSFPLSPLPPARRASTGTRPLSKLIISTSPQSSLITRDRTWSDTGGMSARPRTTSECAPHLAHPPRHPNNLHCRPNSTYNRGISYSPPPTSSPVSPGSGACSTDSAGSSLSMDGDMIDGHWDHSHSSTPDEPHEPPILEETAEDDYAPWIGAGEEEQLNNNERNATLNAPLSSGHNSTNHLQTNNYSPSQVSRLDVNSTRSASRDGYMNMSPSSNNAKVNQRTSISHSRGSSLTEEGYVPMAPGHSDDGYVDMDPSSSRNRDHYQSGEFSTGSSCSVTSGTPSTDQRFSDYPLDKVESYFNNEEEIVPAERPARAWSLGSRPTFNRYRSDMHHPTTGERNRANSVGSKNVKPAYNSLRFHNQPQIGSSHSSMGASDDMMEMDFSKKNRMKSRKKPSSSERLSVPGGSASTLSSAASSYGTAEGSYMEMSPRCSPSLAPSPPKTNRLLTLGGWLGKSPPKHDLLSFTRNSPPVSGYPSPSLGRVPEIDPMYPESESHGLSTTDAYMEMKPRQAETKQKIVAAKTKARIESFPSCGNISHTMPRAKCARDDHLETSLKRKMSHTCTIPEDNNNSKVIISNTPPNTQVDEYVEMDLGAKSPPKNKINEDYLEMDGRGDKHGRRLSQPIAIQASVKEPSHSSIFSLGRKNSTGTTPKRSFLSFGSSPSPVSSPYGTLGRTRPRKNQVRRDSSTMGSASSGSSSSLFPMSLNSSVNSPEDYEPKCPVDATSGTIVLTTDTSRSVDDLTSHVNEMCVVEDSPEDYVLYEPGTSLVDSGDYAKMAPTKPVTRKTSAPLLNFNKKFDRFLQGLGVGQLTSSTSSPSIVKAAASELVVEHVESPSLPEEEEEEDETPAPATRTEEEPQPPKTPVTTKDKELHYASLDLARSGSESEESNKTLKTQNSLTESSASSPSPNPIEGSMSFNYAEIDFVKSGSSQNP